MPSATSAHAHGLEFRPGAPTDYYRRRRASIAAGTWQASRPVDDIRPHLVFLRGRDVPLAVIARQAGVSVKTVRRVLQRQVEHVYGPIAAALLAVVAPQHQEPDRVPVLGTARRLRCLNAGGWSLTEMARRCKIPRQTLAGWLHERVRSVSAADAQIVTDLYDELYAADGPCQSARATAAARGWDREHWLDEHIDDPDALPLEADAFVDPVAVERVLDGDRALAGSLTADEVTEAVRVGTEADASQADLAELLATSTRRICRIRARLRDAGLLPALIAPAGDTTQEEPDARLEQPTVDSAGTRRLVRVACTGRPGTRRTTRQGTGAARHRADRGSRRSTWGIRPGLHRPGRRAVAVVGPRSRALWQLHPRAAVASRPPAALASEHARHLVRHGASAASCVPACAGSVMGGAR